MHRFARSFAVIGFVILSTSCGSRPTAPDDNHAPAGVPPATAPPAPAPPGPAPVSAISFTFSIDQACRSQFPEAVQQRSYRGTSGYSSTATTLTGADFVQSSGLTWNVVYRGTGESTSSWWFQDPPIWERLGEEGYLLIWGTSEYRNTSAYGEWPFWGRVTYCAARKTGAEPACAVPEISCQSDRHRLRVTAN